MTRDQAIRPDNIARGVALILLTALTVSIQDVVIKHFSSDLPLWQTFAVRGLLATATLAAFSLARRDRDGALQLAVTRWPLTRALLITTSLLLFYAVLPFVTLSTAGAAFYLAPVIMALMSSFVIDEPAGPRGWFGVILGFVGVVALLRPGTDAFSAWSLLPVVGASFYALANIVTRVKCQGVPPSALSLSQSAVMTAAGVVGSVLLLLIKPEGEFVRDSQYIFGGWADLDLEAWMVLVLLAGFAIAISQMLGGAYQEAPPAIVATFEYSYLVFVAIWDVVFFDTTHTAASTAGMLMIFVAGLLVVRRN